MPAADLSVMDAGRAIVGAGTPEADWQRWPGLHAVAACGVGDLVPPGARLVVVAPHPDDEVLACGGLLSIAAGRNMPVTVVAVTDGDASHPGSVRWPPAVLAQARRAESTRGLACLGWTAEAQRRLGLPDGQVARHADALVAALRGLLTPRDVVVSTGSLDGHPDHEATGRATAEAAESVGCRHLQAPVWMWHWAAPGDARVPWPQLRRLPLPAEVLARKAAALQAHRTQLSVQDTGAMPVLPPSAIARLMRPDEYFLLPVGD